jgi:hypothetical protein
MMHTMFLSAPDIQTMTGYRQPARQIAWLKENGVRHWVSRTGRPVVPVDAVAGRAQTVEPFRLGVVR